MTDKEELRDHLVTYVENNVGRPIERHSQAWEVIDLIAEGITYTENHE